MELPVAISLIEGGVNPAKEKQKWLDLGCGEGLFTRALQSLLPVDAEIVAVDQDSRALESVLRTVAPLPKVSVVRENILHFASQMDTCNGIVMANVLHLIQDQKTLLRHLANHLQDDGVMILIEYDLKQGNRWVPYPVEKNAVDDLLLNTGLRSVRWLHEVPSRFHRSIYACLISRA